MAIQIGMRIQIGRTRCFVALMLLVPNTDNRGASSPIKIKEEATDAWREEHDIPGSLLDSVVVAN